MIRSFAGVQTVAAASMPVFGTTLAAATTFAVDRYTGTNRPGTTTPAITVQVASTLGFFVNDRVQIGPKANFTRANFLLLDNGTVTGIVDATHLLVQGLTQNHASGEYLVLNECASLLTILPVSMASAYLGTASTVGATDSSTYAGPDPSKFSFPTTLADSYMTSAFWLLGTPGDTFVARFDQV